MRSLKIATAAALVLFSGLIAASTAANAQGYYSSNVSLGYQQSNWMDRASQSYSGGGY